MSLKWRIAIIFGLIAASFWTLFPRTVIERVKRNGEFVYDTVRRVPLKRGLDLQGGMHLALEVDESKGLVADKSKAIDNALKVVRNRIDEFGVSEPVVQKAATTGSSSSFPGSTIHGGPRMSSRNPLFSSFRSPTKPRRSKRRFRGLTRY